jgi:hypothetical protein
MYSSCSPLQSGTPVQENGDTIDVSRGWQTPVQAFARMSIRDRGVLARSWCQAGAGGEGIGRQWMKISIRISHGTWVMGPPGEGTLGDDIICRSWKISGTSLSGLYA